MEEGLFLLCYVAALFCWPDEFFQEARASFRNHHRGCQVDHIVIALELIIKEPIDCPKLRLERPVCDLEK